MKPEEIALVATLASLDKSKAIFRGKQIGERSSGYVGSNKPIYDAIVTVNREHWEEAGCPNAVRVSL